ncbi:DUF501 domain-containing protein [Kocuria sp.]|uniref:DUF501 domain-containing protein n=1 Tax=Kocuria sp. TaxID=1871328 RepID=UPI0026DF661C|nr:DUF501 domain-containing protein [Kocuria sp.]MDO5617540.1 DUF501 domain-containing protein [Kocuria sp.]
MTEQPDRADKPMVTDTPPQTSAQDTAQRGEVASARGLNSSPDTLAPTELDLQVLSRQLGRTVRDVVEIPARCVCGNPLVAATAPRLSNGTPFPTVFYLAHPVITAAVSRLEAEGAMYAMTDRLAQDADLAASYESSHRDFLAERERIRVASGTGEVPEIEGISAGGMPTRVKCLHVLVGHALAAGPGVNRLGDETLEMIAQTWDGLSCHCDPAWREPQSHTG